MSMIYLKLLLNVALIFTFATGYVPGIFPGEHVYGTSVTCSDLLSLEVVEPKSYDIQFNITGGLFRGRSKILIQVYHPTKTISLHTYKTQISQIQLTSEKEAANNKKSIIYVPVNSTDCKISQILHLHFEDAVEPAVYYLKLYFSVSAKINIYKPHANQRNHIRWFFINLFGSMKGKSMFPCWDKPQIKAYFNISVIHPIEYKVLSNMPTSRSEPVEQLTIHELTKTIYWKIGKPRPIGYTISVKSHYTSFETSPLITASEVAIIVTDNDIRNECDSKIVGPYCMSYYPESSTKLNLARSAIFAAQMYLFAYIKRVKKPTIQHIIVPSTRKTIGSTGLIIYRESDVVYSKNDDFVGVKINVAQLITRQTGRQWIGALTDGAPWFDLWITESFATYFSYSSANEAIVGSQELEELFVVQILQTTLHYDIALEMKPANKIDLINSDEIDTVLYSRLYYNKGAIFLRMSQQILTSEGFEERLRRYFTQLSNSETSNLSEDSNLWRKLLRTSDNYTYLHPEVTTVVHNWLRQKHYPVLYVASDDNNTHISADCGKDTHSDIIPVSILIQSFSGSCAQETLIFAEMVCGIKIMPTPDYSHFVLLNLLQVGYYRVNYENRNWERITTYLRDNRGSCIPVQNRAQLIDDAYYFAMAGKLHTHLFFNLLTYLKRETHYVAWYPMFNILFYMSSYWKLPRSNFLKPIILDILSSLLEQIGYEELSEDDGMMKALRLLAAKWACKLGDRKCRNAASAKLYAKYNSSNTKILPWWEKWVYSMGMMQLDSSTWLRILHKNVQKPNVATLQYMGYTNNITLYTHYIPFLYQNSNITSRREELIEHFLKRQLEKKMTREYVLEHIDEIADTFYQNDTFILLWGNIIWSLHTRSEIDKILELSNKVGKSYSPGQEVMMKLIKARSNELEKIRKKFSVF